MLSFKQYNELELLDEGKRLKALMAAGFLAVGMHHAAHSQEAPKQGIEQAQEVPSHKIAHDDMKSAAMTGMHTCKTTMDPKLECGFGVYQAKDGKFYHTEVQSGKNGSIDGMSIKMPSTAKLVAFGHTHPAEPHAGGDDTSNYFSKNDLSYAKKSGLHMYMGSQKSGKVVEYQHGKTKTWNHTILGKISSGDEVGDYT